MRQSPNRKPIFVDCVSVPEKPNDEVAAPHVMRKIAEELFAKRIVTHVLDGRAAVGIRMRLAQLLLRGSREASEQQRSYGIVPCQVDKFLVGKNGVRGALGDANYHRER